MTARTRTIPAALALAAVAALAAPPSVAFDPDAAFMIAYWDGRDTGPEMWFEIDGVAAPSVRLERVRSVPEGLEVRAEAGRLVLSSALARLLDVAPGAPALIAVRDAAPAAAVVAAEPLLDPLALDSEHPDALAAEAALRGEGATSYAALADHIARVEGLFGSMRADVARADAAALSAAARRDAEAEAAPVVAEARRGGLIPYGWDDAGAEDAP